MKKLNDCFSWLIWLVEVLASFAHGFVTLCRESFSQPALFAMRQTQKMLSVAQVAMRQYVRMTKIVDNVVLINGHFAHKKAVNAVA